MQMSRFIFSKSILEKYYGDQWIEKSNGSHKYIRKVPKSTGKGWNYFYPKDFAKPIKALLTLFGMKEEKITSAYEKNNIEADYGVNKQSFAQHVLEYLTNRETWNKFFSDKFNRDRYKTPTKSEKAPAKKTSGGSSSTGTKSGEERNFKVSWNRSLMRKIYSMYNAIPEDKTTPATESADVISENDKVNYKGRIGTVTKVTGTMAFVKFDDGGSGKLFLKDLVKDTSALSEAMMGNQNAKKDGISEEDKKGFKLILTPKTPETDKANFFSFNLSGIPADELQAKSNEIVHQAIGKLLEMSFSKDEATDFLMNLYDKNWLENKDKEEYEIPEEIKDKLTRQLWVMNGTIHNSKLAQLLSDIQNDRENNFLRDLIWAVNTNAELKYDAEVNEKTVPDSYTPGDTTIGGIKMDADEYEYLMNRVEEAHKGFERLQQLSPKVQWTPQVFNLLMAGFLKKDADAVNKIANIAMKYKLEDIPAFMLNCKDAYDSRNGYLSAEAEETLKAANTPRTLVDKFGKQRELTYDEINEGLSEEDQKNIYDEMRKISHENSFSISPEDLQKYLNEWKQAIKLPTIREQNLQLLKIYSVLEDSNWHGENTMLMQGRFDDLQKEIDAQMREQRVWRSRNGILERIKNGETVGADYFQKLRDTAENTEETDAINEAEKQYNEDQRMAQYRLESDRWDNYKKVYAETRKDLQERGEFNTEKDVQDALTEELKDWKVDDKDIYDEVTKNGLDIAAKKAKIDLLTERLNGFKTAQVSGNMISPAVAGNLPDGITLDKIAEKVKTFDPYKVKEQLYQELTKETWWGYGRSRDELENEKWENVQEIARLYEAKNSGLNVLNGQVESNVIDGAGNKVKEGDYVQVSNSYGKSENGLYKVRTVTYKDGKHLTLVKVKKDGTESLGGGSLSWPLNGTYSSNPTYRYEYAKHNGKNGENVKIDVVTIDPALREKAKNKPKVTGYQFTSKGVRKPDGEYIQLRYELNDDGSVYVTNYDYKHLGFLASDTDHIENNTDSQTDYFENDRITVTASNPLYQQVKRAALKDQISSLKNSIADAEADVKRYTENKNLYNGEYYLNKAKERLAKNPKLLTKYENELKKLEKDMKAKDIKKSLPLFLIHNGRFLVRK